MSNIFSSLKYVLLFLVSLKDGDYESMEKLDFLMSC